MKAIITYLRQLQANNNREWFNAHKDEFLKHQERFHQLVEEVIRETIHDVPAICSLLEECGFHLRRCADRMLDDGGHGTTWFLIATK